MLVSLEVNPSFYNLCMGKQGVQTFLRPKFVVAFVLHLVDTGEPWIDGRHLTAVFRAMSFVHVRSRQQRTYCRPEPVPKPLRFVIGNKRHYHEE